MTDNAPKNPLSYNSVSLAADNPQRLGTGYLRLVIISFVLELFFYLFFAFLDLGSTQAGDQKHPRQDLYFCFGMTAPAVNLFILSVLRCWTRRNMAPEHRRDGLLVVVLSVTSIILGYVFWQWVKLDLLEYDQPWQ